MRIRPAYRFLVRILSETCGIRRWAFHISVVIRMEQCSCWHRTPDQDVRQLDCDQINMANHAIHWAEGLFLRPQHFQTAERNLGEQIRLSEDWNVSYSYGIRRIEIDEDALANWRLVLRTCHIRLHDGSHVRFPEDANLSPTDLPKNAFDRQDRVMVYLGIPQLKLGRNNAEHSGGDLSTRYLVDSVEIEDENQAGNSQMLEVRWTNARLLIGDDHLSGYEALPVMRLRRGTMAEAPPEIDPEYIPPVLACDAWPILKNEIVDAIVNQVGSRVESLKRAMFDRNVAFESGHREDLEIIFKLHALNSALGYLWNLPVVKGIHPLTAYMELCRVVGMLAIFWPERRMPEVPRYDHDDLGGCFYAVKRLLQETGAKGPEVVKRLFTGAGLQMQVRMEREWLEPNWVFFIGVESKLSYNEVVNLLRGELNMKVGSSRQVDTTFLKGQSGVRLNPEPEPPRALPGRNWAYWKVDRTSHAWKDVEDTLSLGVRINDTQVEGRIDGAQEVLIKTNDGRPIKMTFALFATPVQHLS